MDRPMFLAMMKFFRLPANEVAKLLHPGEYQQLKWRAVVRKVQTTTRIARFPKVTIIGYSTPVSS